MTSLANCAGAASARRAAAGTLPPSECDQERCRPLTLADVALHAVHGTAGVVEVGDRGLELRRLPRNLEDHPARVRLDVGAADVRDDVELLDDLVDHRPVHQLL